MMEQKKVYRKMQNCRKIERKALGKTIALRPKTENGLSVKDAAPTHGAPTDAVRATL
jgi:hypothetical protein